VLGPPVAQERVERRPLRSRAHHVKKAYTDGTIAVDMDPLSLLCRLATSVPPPRLHTIRYAGVLTPSSPGRWRLAPQAPPHKPPQRATSSEGPWAILAASCTPTGAIPSRKRGRAYAARPQSTSARLRRYLRSSACMVAEPSTRRMLARPTWDWLAAATEPSICLEIASCCARAPSRAAQFL